MARQLASFGEHLPGQLLVEGSNDFHVLCSLFNKRKLPKDCFGIKEKGSYEELCEGLDLELDVENVETIGIIVDADVSPHERWQKELRPLLESLGYKNLPETLSIDGCIFTDGRKRLGIWLMPDNDAVGILENFVGRLVRENDKLLWNHAQSAIQGIPAGCRLFPDIRLAKAQMYTWLAWQKEPGIPMGRAIMERYLDPNSTAADSFIDWIIRLFQLETTISIKPE